MSQRRPYVEKTGLADDVKRLEVLAPLLIQGVGRAKFPSATKLGGRLPDKSSEMPSLQGETGIVPVV